jgi:DNA adenine methylase
VDSRLGGNHGIFDSKVIPAKLVPARAASGHTLDCLTSNLERNRSPITDAQSDGYCRRIELHAANRITRHSRLQTLTPASTPSEGNDGQRWPTLRPPLKWAGGKRWLVPYLRTLWSKYTRRRLVEPFCGGLAIALGLDPRRALLNDVNPHPVNFYRHLQRGLAIKIAMRNERELYYQHRADFNRLVTGRGSGTRKAAEIFYYLNRTGYNGLCRFNSRGEFNVPFGRHPRIHYTWDFTPYAAPLLRWTFTADDFGAIDLSPKDFIYADPPYDVEFRQYASEGFDWYAQERLATWLARHPGPVVASNQATERIVKLYRGLGFHVGFLDGPRRISRTGDRTPAREILATRNVDQPRL